MSDVRNAAGVPKTYRGFLWSKVIDAMVGSSVAQGDILYRGASAWARLAAGTSGRFLKTLGAGNDPQWATVSGGGSTGVINPKQRYDYIQDFEGGASSAGWLATGGTSGTGSISTVSVAATSLGTVTAATGTTAASFAFYGLGPSLAGSHPCYVADSTALEIEWKMAISDANTVTHQYETYFGSLTTLGAGVNVFGVTAGNKWSGSADVWFIRAVDAGSATTTNAVTGPTPATQHHLRLVITTSQVELFVDGVSVATHSTGLPTGGVLGRPIFGIQKTAGSGVNRTCVADLVHVHKDWGSDRF